MPSLLGMLVPAPGTDTVPSFLLVVLSLSTICLLSSWFTGSSLCLRQVALMAHTGHSRNADQAPRASQG